MANKILFLCGGFLCGGAIMFGISRLSDPPAKVRPRISDTDRPEDAAECRMEMRRVAVCAYSKGAACNDAMAAQYNDCMSIKELDQTLDD